MRNASGSAGAATRVRRGRRADPRRRVGTQGELPLEKANDNGWELLVRHRSHPDATEGPAAFLEKRAPRWADE